MAKVIDDEFHHMASAFVSTKYTTHADDRQKSMGLSYVTAEKQDLISEVAHQMRMAYALGREVESDYQPDTLPEVENDGVQFLGWV